MAKPGSTREAMVALDARESVVDQVLFRVERFGVLRQGGLQCHAGWPAMGGLGTVRIKWGRLDEGPMEWYTAS
jgi:hypothetical protein